MEQAKQMVIKKAVSLLVLLALLLTMVLATTASALAQSGVGVVTGVLEKPEVTTYQYGTHAITDEASDTRYALQSESVNLDAYVGERVTIYGVPVPGYQNGQVEGGPDLLRVDRVVPADGPPSERSATLSFELAVECDPPDNATFFGNVRTGEGGPGIFAQLLDPDGDGLYTGVATLPDRFGPGPAPEGTEPVSLPVSVVQGAGTRSTSSATFPGEPISIVKDFGAVPMEAENAFSASASFCEDGGSDDGGSGNDDGNGSGNGSGNGGNGTVSGDTGAGGSSSGGSGSASASGSATAAGGGGSGTKILPATGGSTLLALGAGALLVGGGILARRIAR